MFDKKESNLTRREFLRTLGGSAAAVAGISGLAGYSHAAERPLKVSTYGGIFKEVMDEALVKPFMEETGIKVENKPFDVESAFIEVKSAVDAGKAPVDVPIISERGVLKGLDLGIWKLYSPKALDNIQYVPPSLITESEEMIAGIGALSWYLNLVYNTDVVDEDLNSWTTFWDSKYKNMCGINRLPDDSYLLDIAAVTYFGGQDILETKDGILEVLDKVVEVKPQAKVWWTNEAEFEGPLKSGEAPIGQLYNDITLVMAEQGAPVRSVFPREGGVLDHGEWGVIKTTPKFAEALLFIDYACRPDVQNRISKKLYTAPALKRDFVELPEDMEKKINGPGASAAIKPEASLYTGEMDEFIKTNWDQKLFG